MFTCGGYAGMMNALCYYKGDLLCCGELADGSWYIIGTEKR